MNLSANKIFLFISICFISYINTFNVAWQLDDIQNIVLNEKLHINTLNFSQINDALRANPDAPDSNNFYRPLPCLTFGLNWYIGQDNVLGYHVVNLVIHIITAWFLFLTLHLLVTIYYRERESQHERFFLAAALLGALFWALAPIQTQAVTYIVQRMASMAAMFTIIAIYTYLRGRTEKKYGWFILCLLSFFAALASKENAILLPASLVLIEFAFFRHHITKKQVFLSIFASILLLIAGFFFVRYGLGLTPFKLSNPLNFLDSYANRSFTFTERILTQPRIVLMYLSQIFLPVADRLSIEHDVVLSRSLFSPWTTLPAILLIFGLISSALIFLKKYTLLCFPILFFFLNHSVESTILQLELVFEHRNYLPSFFLFLPLGVLIAKILYDHKAPRFRRGAVAFCTTLFLIIFGHATYTRNAAWASEESLWTDAFRKAPNSTRAAYMLGLLYEQSGIYSRAYHFYELALHNTNQAATPKDMKTASINGLGTVTYGLGFHEPALQNFNQCLEIQGDHEVCLKNRVLAYLRLGRPHEALTDALKLTDVYPRPVEYQYLTAMAAHQTGDMATALDRVQQIAGRSLDNHEVMYLAGRLLLQEGSYPNSIFFFKLTNKLSPDTIEYQIALAAAYHAAQEAALTEAVLRDIVNRYPLPRIRNALQKIQIESGTVSFISSRIDSMIQAISHETS